MTSDLDEPSNVPSAEGSHKVFRLSYGDTDASGIVYFAAWFPHMERMVSDWLHLRGVRFDHMGQRFGSSAVTRSATCEYLDVLGVYDQVAITMAARPPGRSSYGFDFEVTNTETGVVAARAAITFVQVSPAGAACQIPPQLADILNEGSQATDERHE